MNIKNNICAEDPVPGFPNWIGEVPNALFQPFNSKAGYAGLQYVLLLDSTDSFGSAVTLRSIDQVLLACCLSLNDSVHSP